ncbi:MAG TPA: shikimate kinase [Pyrinomonadaceae bacterium]|nr:shikimate kinase [Pyrinomonadaceae bacterium]
MSETRIVITGFMGAGKTTVARALARLLAATYVSLDDLITQHEGRTPQALIDEEGEGYFRDAETRALRRALAAESALVIDTGGGAWTLARNRELIASDGCLAVWLDAPFELCWQRITRDAPHAGRPLARDRAHAERLYEQRRVSYQLADLRVRVTPERSPEELAAEIARRNSQKPDRERGRRRL